MTGLLSVAGSTASDSGFELKSVRITRDNDTYLARTPSVAGNRKIWTASFWFKQSDIDVSKEIISVYEDSNNRLTFGFHGSSNKFYLYDLQGGSAKAEMTSDMVFRDPSAWYHFVLVYNTTESSSDDRLKVFINGSGSPISLTWTTAISLNLDGMVNKAVVHQIGEYPGSAQPSLGGYLAEFYLIDGQALTPSSFGATNEDTNQWQPKNPTDIKPTLTFGTNGFYLPFSNDALDDSFTDSSTLHSVHTVTAGGNAHTDTSVKKFGTASLQLDGTGDYLSVSNNNDFNLGTDDFTIDCWVQSSDFVPGADAGVIIHLQDSGSSDFRLAMGSAGRAVVGQDYGMSWGYNNGGSWSTTAYGSDLADGAWHHVACSRQGSYFYLFQDGVLVSTTTNWAGLNITGNATCEIGRRSTGQDYFEGYIDEIRVSKGIARWTSTFALETSAYAADEYTALLLHMDGSDSGTTFTDSSWTSTSSYLSGTHVITAYGDTKNTRISNHSVAASGDAHIIGPKVGSSAISFDGDGDYLSVASSTDFDFGTGDFTLEMWCNSSNLLTTTHVYLLDMNDGTSRIAIASNIASSNGIWLGTGWNNITDWAFPTDEWFHIAVCRQSGTGRAYLNGVLKSSVSSFTTNFGGTWTTHIGDKYDNGANAELEGYLDEIRLSNIARYPDGTTFTPSTTAFTSDANTKLLIHSNTTMGSTTFTDSSSGAHTITANGDIMNVAPKIGTGMGVFDGVASYLENPDSGDWDFGSGDFTIEYWVNYSTPSGNMITTGRGTGYGGSSDNRWTTNHGTGGNVTFSLSNGTGSSASNTYSFASSGLSLDDDAWHHIACVRDGLVARIYTDGVQRNTQALVSGFTLQAASGVNQIGRYPNYSYTQGFKGYLDEMRFSRNCRYPSGTTFTPSTTAFKDDKDTVLLMHMDGGGGIDPVTNLPTLAGQGTYFWDASTNAIFYGADGIPTNKSIITFDGSGDYLSMPASSGWDITGDYTWECWVNPNKNPTTSTAVHMQLMGQYLSATDRNQLFLSDNGGVYMWLADGGSSDWYGNTGYQFDPGVWYHVAASRASGTLRVYIDGVELFNASSSLDTDFSAPYEIGRKGDNSLPFDGKMDQVRISDTARYTSNFTAPTTPFTADANTKLLIQSDFSEGGLGADHSGNYNYWTPNNLTVNDMMLDSPMNNFATLNPLPANYGAGPRNTYQTMSEGNLKTMGNTATDSANVSSTIAFTEGKWYFECYVVGVSASYNYPRIGMIDTPNTGLPSRLAGEANTLGVTYQTNGEKGIAGTFSSYGDTFTTGDVVGMAIDADNGAAYFSKNGTWQNSGVPTSGASKTNAAYTYTGGSIEFTPSWIPYTSAGGGVANFGQDSSFAGNLTAQGNQDGNSKGDFFYAPPAGFLALCTDNLPDPLISAVEALDHFNTVAYSGDGTTPRTLNAGFQPDFTWLKIRTVAWSHRLFDSIRGANLALYSNSNAVQAAGTSGYLSGFASTGPTFTGNGADVRDVNETGDTYVTWNWKAGGAPTVDNSAGAGNTPTAGSVKINGSNLGSALAGSIATTRLSANTTAGFSISTYTGNSTAGATIAHGLSQAPDIAFFKELTYVDNWVVFAEPLGNTKALFLDTANDAGTHLTYWNDTSPNATVITLGTDGKANSARTHIMYAFHSVDGYSKVGSYTGNGNVDGTFVYTGFRPAYVLWKSYTAAENWQIKDNKRLGYNQQNHTLFANDTAIDYTTAYVDLVSNGFKLRISGGGSNGTNEGLVYIAFAESPFKTSNAR